MARIAQMLAIVALSAFAPSCRPGRPPMHPEPPAGSWYVVASGDTLETIAKRAGVPAEDILEINGLPRAADVRPGKLIYVLAGPSKDMPDGPGGAVIGPLSNPGLIGAGARLIWPLANVPRVVGSPFGARDGRAHEGIDLPAPMGTPVLATEDGVVVYAGDGIHGYGKLIVLQHKGDLLTVYAHNSNLFVAQGQAVRTGERIAAVGQTGRATGPHLHFEVRQGQLAEDPMPYLAAPTTAVSP